MIHAQPLSFEAPQTRGAFLTAAHTILLTNEHAMIPEGPDSLWRITPSIQALRRYTSFYIGNKKRKCDQTPTCTHYLEVAHALATCPELQHYPREVLAFIGYAHDLVEDLGRSIIADAKGNPLPLVTPEHIVKNCWKGDPSFIPLITTCLHLLTDPHELKGEVRLSYQPFIANSEATGIVRHARYYDKKCTYLRDLACYTNNGFPTNADADDALYKMDLRIGIVDRLHINERYKLEFRDITDRIKWIIRNRDKINGDEKEKILGKEFLTNGLPPYAFFPRPKGKLKRIASPSQPCWKKTKIDYCLAIGA